MATTLPPAATTITSSQNATAGAMGINAVGQVFVTIFGALTAAIQLDMQKSALTHRADMAKGAFKMEKEKFAEKDKLVDDLGKMQGKVNTAKQVEARSEGQVATVKEQLRQQKQTEQASRRTNQQSLDRLFARYNYGSPVATL